MKSVFDQAERASESQAGKKAGRGRPMDRVIMGHNDPKGRFDRYQAMADMAGVGHTQVLPEYGRVEA